MMDLTDRVAVVTGGGSGIGFAVAKRLRDLNASVLLLGRSEEKLERSARSIEKDLKGTAYYACDVREEEQVLEVNRRILRQWNRTDILVTCAAAPPVSGKTEELKFEDWKSVLEVDLNGVFLCCKIFGSNMLQNRYGRIVNLTSFHNIATYPERAAYNAAKSGVEGLTRALAVEWGCFGITVNAVAPGPIRTPRTSWFLARSPEVESEMIGRTPNARLGETDDVAALVAFLASDHAKHLNGQQIVLDGGWTKCAWWGTHERKYSP